MKLSKCFNIFQLLFIILFFFSWQQMIRIVVELNAKKLWFNKHIHKISMNVSVRNKVDTKNVDSTVRSKKNRWWLFWRKATIFIICRTLDKLQWVNLLFTYHDILQLIEKWPILLCNEPPIRQIIANIFADRYFCSLLFKLEIQSSIFCSRNIMFWAK